MRGAGLEPAVGHDAANLRGRGGHRLERDRRGQSRARARWRAGPARPPPWRTPRPSSAPRNACWPSPAHTGRRRPRRWRLGRCGRAAPTQLSSSAVRCRASATRAGARGSGWSPRPTRATRAFCGCGPRSRSSPTLEMDHHSHWGSIAELRAAFERFAEPAGACRACRRPPRFPGLGRRGRRFRRGPPGPADLQLAVSGRHNLANARAALAAIGLAGADRDAGAAALAEFPGVRRRAGAEGRTVGGPRLRRLRPPPDRGPGGDRCTSRARAGAADRGLPAAPVLADESVRRAVPGRPSRSPTRSPSSTSTPPARSRSAPSPGSAALTWPAPPRTEWGAAVALAARPRPRRSRAGPESRPGRDPRHDRRRRHPSARRCPPRCGG